MLSGPVNASFSTCVDIHFELLTECDTKNHDTHNRVQAIFTTFHQRQLLNAIKITRQPRPIGFPNPSSSEHIDDTIKDLLTIAHQIVPMLYNSALGFRVPSSC